ncbi:hypothetical protein [Kitasatospora sp. NPDC059571]|uniref:hypothetical protein n=1 Tax=Kitasatospora sp. NPDC059571 TaxID=3346871 RepID=UPI0036A7EC4F
MTSAVPLPRPHRPEPAPGDAVRAPRELMSGPGRSWDAEPRWSSVEIRIGGLWRPARLERWRIHQHHRQWVALVRWGPDTQDWGWFLYETQTLRQAPRRTPAGTGRARDTPFRP